MGPTYVSLLMLSILASPALICALVVLMCRCSGISMRGIRVCVLSARLVIRHVAAAGAGRNSDRNTQSAVGTYPKGPRGSVLALRHDDFAARVVCDAGTHLEGPPQAHRPCEKGRGNIQLAERHLRRLARHRDHRRVCRRSGRSGLAHGSSSTGHRCSRSCWASAGCGRRSAAASYAPSAGRAMLSEATE